MAKAPHAGGAGEACGGHHSAGAFEGPRSAE